MKTAEKEISSLETYFSEHPELSRLFYDNGMTRLENGNLLFGNNNNETIYEVNMLGEIINRWPLTGYEFHHHVIEKPNGNFLVTVNDKSKTTVEDVILEIDRESGGLVNQWDLNLSLDNSRRAWDSPLADLDVDVRRPPDVFIPTIQYGSFEPWRHMSRLVKP